MLMSKRLSLLFLGVFAMLTGLLAPATGELRANNAGYATTEPSAPVSVAATAEPEDPTEIWVCKLVGPQLAPRVQSGNNPILVDEDAVFEDEDGRWRLNDQHGSPVLTDDYTFEDCLDEFGPQDGSGGGGPPGNPSTTSGDDDGQEVSSLDTQEEPTPEPTPTPTPEPKPTPTPEPTPDDEAEKEQGTESGDGSGENGEAESNEDEDEEEEEERDDAGQGGEEEHGVDEEGGPGD